LPTTGAPVAPICDCVKACFRLYQHRQVDFRRMCGFLVCCVSSGVVSHSREPLASWRESSTCLNDFTSRAHLWSQNFPLSSIQQQRSVMLEPDCRDGPAGLTKIPGVSIVDRTGTATSSHAYATLFKTENVNVKLLSSLQKAMWQRRTSLHSGDFSYIWYGKRACLHYFNSGEAVLDSELHWIFDCNIFCELWMNTIY